MAAVAVRCGRPMLKLVILLVVLLGSVRALFEDQIDKFDWRKQLIGRIERITPVHLSTSQSFLVSTDRSVLASVFVRNGTLAWRQVLELPGTVNTISNSDPLFGLNRAQPLLSISGNGRYVRAWDTMHGLLEWERPLPEEVSADVDGQATQILFNIRQEGLHSKQITVAKFYKASRQVELGQFELINGQWARKQSAATQRITINGQPQWHPDANSCSFITSRYLVCMDNTALTLQLLVVGESKAFVPVSLANFGLKTTKKPTGHLRVVSVGVQELESEPVFAVELGGDGFVVLRLHQSGQQPQVKLVKVLPNAKAVAVVPIQLPPPGKESAKQGVFVLIAKPEELKKRDEDINKQLFRVAVFELDTWEELRDLNGQFAIESRSEIGVEKFCVLPFFKAAHNAPLQYKILLTTDDDAVILASAQGKGVAWIREEALSSVLSTEMIDLPLSELDASIEQAFGLSSNMVTQFMARIASQVYQFQTWAKLYANRIAELLVAPAKPHGRAADDDDDADFYTISSQQNKLNEAALVRDYFGFHKIIVVLTKPGKLFGIDTFNGNILWSFYERSLRAELMQRQKRLPIYVQRTTAHFPFDPVATIVTPSGLILSFNPVTGDINEKLQMPATVKQTMLMSHLDQNFIKGVLILNANNHASVYPSSAIDAFFDHKHAYYLLVGNEKTGLLEGFSFAHATRSEPLAHLVWSLTIPLSSFESQNRLDIVFKRTNEQIHSLGRVLGDRNVLYKYLNPNLVVVAVEGAEAASVADGPSKSQPHYINLYLLDAITGAVLHTTAHKRCKGPLHLVHTENSIIYSYYNEKSRRTEISSIELYEGFEQTNATAFSSVERPYIKPPVVEHQTFIFPTGLIAMTDTQTEKGITNKHLLVALPSGALFELPKAFLDPRRPIHPTMEHKEEGLIPYIPEIPIPSEGIINYNKTLMQIKAIDVAPSGLESTCLVFAYGLDLFYTRVTPSKTFDILKDDFDHILITAVLVILVTLGYISKWLAARKTLKNAWK